MCVQPAPPQVDLGRLGGVLKSIHHSIRLRNRHNPATLATITDNALKDVFNHVSADVSICCKARLARMVLSVSWRKSLACQKLWRHCSPKTKIECILGGCGL